MKYYEKPTELIPRMKTLGGSETKKSASESTQTAPVIEEKIHLLMVDDYIPAGAKLY